MSGEESHRLRLREDAVAARRFGAETVILDLAATTYLATNSAGSDMWERLERGTTRDELVQALCDRFDVDAERAGRDVDAFLDDCRRRQLLAG